MSVSTLRPRVTELRMEVVRYRSLEGEHVGTNLMYKVDGSQRSSRVPWVASQPAAEVARLERLLVRTGR